MKVAYKHLLNFLDDKPTIDDLSNKLFQLGHENEFKNEIFDIEFTPNRGDCLSLIGLARDLNAFYKTNLKLNTYKDRIESLSMNFINQSAHDCPSISFLKIEIGKIPKKYHDYLESYFLDLNIPKNNFFADISNYISYEMGQPTHAYDSAKINGQIVFKTIKDNVEFRTLTKRKITLSGLNSIFTLNEEVINLAGIMGGETTCCSLDTTTALIECAHFNPEAIIGKAVKYDLHTDASHKFERFVDPDCHQEVMRRFIQIVEDHTDIKNIEYASYQDKEPAHKKIPIDLKKVNKILGLNISKDIFKSYLTKIGFLFEAEFIEVPSYRNDISHQNDIAEEIARLIGYDNIKPQKITISSSGLIHDLDKVKKIKSILVDNGFVEVVNQPFIKFQSNGSIAVDNPLDINRKYLRTSMTDSLVNNLIFNEKRQKDNIKLFEISDIYTMHDGDIVKTNKLCLIISGRAGRNFKDFSKKLDKGYLSELLKDLFQIKPSAINEVSRKALNTKIKSSIFSCEVDINSIDFSSHEQGIDIQDYGIKINMEKCVQYRAISEFPSTYRDVSFSITDYKNIEDLLDTISKVKSKNLKESFLFDFFKNDKAGEVKAGFRFIFQSINKTLTDIEVDEQIDYIINQGIKINGVYVQGYKRV